MMQHEALGPAVADEQAAGQIEIQAKYAGYIGRQEDEIARSLRQETTKIPENMDYSNISGLSAEIKQKLNKAKPATIGVASRMQGITPAAISLLLVHVKRCAS
jgi:tRNA uridine 5-carboxymethylaminomethyl modification enzyme